MISYKYSYLKKILGLQTYYGIKDSARKIIPIATGFLFLLWGLSLIVHWEFISSLLNIATGATLLFVAYIAGLIILLDKEIVVVQEDKENKENLFSDDMYLSCHAKEAMGFLKTKVIGISLIILGIVAIFFTEQYKRNYAFECQTFLVNNKKKIYHLDCDNDCDVAAETSNLEKMKGYQIDPSYSLCNICEEWAESTGVDVKLTRY